MTDGQTHGQTEGGDGIIPIAFSKKRGDYKPFFCPTMIFSRSKFSYLESSMK